ncbi:MAG: sodium-translocating pyrophosphatase [Bullifex sp.]|nr:sodium-translocating pyrophosphatase [Spirochaetales bacterium]MDD7535930.1 sodium-translocating pyrophosphatase [Spirochaetales bacterium]MDY2815724.1 sodium-translocating pyrophosphatase [Bullifex sp.]MDY4797863.1 sodium-translocating pyrophosphatase [Bullifex sp.]MDY5777619.1 sodium-translocating pyrophosphatase [Bullifex sp.]
MFWYIVLCIIVLALAYVFFSYRKVKAMEEGTAEMAEMAGIIRSGAGTFMKTEYRTIAIVVAAVAVIFSLFVEKTSGLTLILGAIMSSAACITGMKSATYANVRTSNTARKTLNIGQTVKVALLGGSISGLSVQAFGLFGLIAILLVWGIGHNETGTGFLLSLECNPFTMRITTYSLGCSLVAMFNRVAGGNYTKAADISSDILAKLRHDLPEDDSRVPNVIADFIGDNVNDIAGNCSDLLESFVATTAAGILISSTLFSGGKLSASAFDSAMMYPVVLAGGGLLGCLIGLFIIQKRKMGDDPSKELNYATYISAALTLLIGLGTCYMLFSGAELPDTFLLGWASPWVCAVLGIISGVAIGMITEYYTSADCRPTQQLAEMATEGEAFVITKGDAIGSRSCLYPVLLIAIALFASGKLCGTYGIALASLGMLSFVGTTVSIDAFGPIADNAGGLAESCHLPHNVRIITDKLDAVGNTTAAIGKGFAIGSAAFATVSLIVAYVGSYSTGEPILNFASYVVVAGGILGGALVEYFSAILTDNTIDSAKKMADDGDKLLSIPGVLEGTVKPDYNVMIRTATEEALRKMLFPSILALVIPVIGGLLFGVEFVGGLLVGATVVAIPRAIFMGNSGGAFDNAKKFIEQERIPGHGKGSAAHKASVTGDTVGDTRKDVVGVALDIFIKSMSTVANTLGGVIRMFTIIK